MIVSSSGLAEALGAGVGDCAQSVVATAKIDNKRQNICRISKELVRLQEAMQFLGQFSADSLGGCDLIDARLPQPIPRAKSSQKETFPVLTHARTIIENAFIDALFEEQLVISVREPVGFVANSLEQMQRAGIRRQLQRHRAARSINFFVFLCQADDR